MGNSHFRSNMIGKDGDEYIASLDYLKLTSGEKLAEGGIKLGTRSCIVWGTATLVANMELAATSFLGAVPYPGSTYMCMATSGGAARGGGLYIRGYVAASWSQQFGA